MREQQVPSIEGGHLALPDGEPHGGVLVLAGSSGRVDTDRARLFAESGLAALSMRYFGGEQQPPGICEVPLETLAAGIDVLAEHAPAPIGIVGISKGAEAALALASRDPRIDAVIALSPSSVAWANIGSGLDGAVRPQRSSWTWRGEPLPFVPYDDSWPVPAEPIAYRPMYEQSLAADLALAERAALRVEDSAARLLLVAGADDQLWPSDRFAEQLSDRRRGRDVEVLISRDAGHHVTLPGEKPRVDSSGMAYGGSAEASAELGRRAWPAILRTLGV